MSAKISGRVAGGFALMTLALGCATSPLGRKQLILLPDDQMNQMGAQAFSQMKTETPVSADSRWNAYVNCVTDPIVQIAKKKTGIENWEIVVFQADDTINAFALPGGKIGVYTGILKVAKTDGQLATVLGHEVGHVIARHGNERMSEGVITQAGLAAVSAALSGRSGDSTIRNLALGALGVGTQVGIELPHSRTQEAEADLIGQEVMAEAGYDPRQSVELWKNMVAAAGGKAPPQILSDHPADANRIQALQENLPKTLPIFQAGGARQACARP